MEPIKRQDGVEMTGVIVPPKKKVGKGTLFCMIACLALAIISSGFGVYGMIAANNAKKTASAPQEDATKCVTKEKETKKASNTSTTAEEPVVMNAFGFQAANLISEAEYTVSYLPGDTHTLIHTIGIATPQKSARYQFYMLKADGELEAHAAWHDTSDSAIITSKFSGKVVDIAFGQIGNGGTSWLIALLNDGTIATLQEPVEKEEFAESATKVEGASDIVKLYGNFNDSLSIFGYAQDKTGKIHNIVADTTTSPFTFKLAN